MLTSRSIRNSVITAGVLIAAACDPVSGPEPGAGLEIISGDKQVALPRSEFLRPLRVRARDEHGAPRVGAVVKWKVSGGTLFPDSGVTNAEGIATSAVWRVQSVTTGTLNATARLEGTGEVQFTGVIDPNAFILRVAPETLKFTSLDDTVRAMIRLRAFNNGGENIDTLVTPNGASWNLASPVTIAIAPGISASSVWQAIRNGTGQITLRFGDGFASATAVVKQVPVGARIVRVGSSLPAPDTIVVAPDSTFALGVVAVDARGRIVEDSSLVPGVTWGSSNSSVATMTNGSARSVGDGNATISAQFGGITRQTVVRVWTMQPKSFAVGGHTTCAILADASLACWGSSGTIPIGGNLAQPPGVRFAGPFVSLDLAETGSVCSVNASGAAYCWGANSSGQLGTGSTAATVATPTPVAGGLTFKSVVTGIVRSCGLTTAGKLYCWGLGSLGALGNGTYGAATCGSSSSWCTSAPSEVAGGRTWKQVAVGDGIHACAIADDDRAFCWGHNFYAQLGSARATCAGYAYLVASSNYCSNVPVEVEGGRRYKAIAVGVGHSCAITTEGALWCWGNNLYSVIGSESAVTGLQDAQMPIAVAPERRFASVYLGRNHSCAIDEAGAAWCWGQGSTGQLGTGTTITGACVPTGSTCARTPTAVAGGLTFKSLDLGILHTCGITPADVVYCWGYGVALGSGAIGGVFGVNDIPNRNTPSRVVFQKP